MTYGEFLRFCRTKAGSATKAEFARKMGFVDPEHYVGAEHDKPSLKPSLDLLEHAAQAAGFELQDFLQKPSGQHTPRSREHEQLHRQLQDLLNLADEATAWVIGNIRTFHKAYVGRGRGR